MMFPVVRILIDGGGNDGRACLQYTRRFFPNVRKVYVFEPNPVFKDTYGGTGLQLINKAIWVENCKKAMYISKDTKQVASSLIPDKSSKTTSEVIPDWHCGALEVECLDFSQWLRDNVKHYHHVILKLDIEGAEYVVLPKLIADGTIKLIKELYVEFHHNIPGYSYQSYTELVDQLTAIGLPPRNWD